MNNTKKITEELKRVEDGLKRKIEEIGIMLNDPIWVTYYTGREVEKVGRYFGGIFDCEITFRNWSHDSISGYEIHCSQIIEIEKGPNMNTAGYEFEAHNWTRRKHNTLIFTEEEVKYYAKKAEEMWKRYRNEGESKKRFPSLCVRVRGGNNHWKTLLQTSIDSGDTYLLEEAKKECQKLLALDIYDIRFEVFESVGMLEEAKKEFEKLIEFAESVKDYHAAASGCENLARFLGRYLKI